MTNGKTRLGSKIHNIRKFLDEMFEGDVHARRVESLAGATLGVMTSASLAVAAIGQALAQARGLLTKHAVKQVDRLLSNQGIVVWEMFAYWVPQIVGDRKDIVVAMDWTDFDADGQTTLVLSLVTTHGRATPLLWLTVRKDELKETRNDFEDLCLMRLSQVLPEGVKAIILADRGFGDHKLFAYLEELGFGYVIRFRGDIQVTSAKGETRAASAWVGKGGRANKLRGAKVTAVQHPVGAVVCVHDKDMKEPWCLATSQAEATTREIINYYSRRWSIEPSFRDAKDLHFGMGLSSVHIKSPARRDRLLLLNAFAIVLLTLLGAAGESLGMDRHLKANTAKHRTHSLFRQGCMLYELIPNMPVARLRPLIKRFAELLLQYRAFRDTFAII
jgi:Transposase DDE domain